MVLRDRRGAHEHRYPETLTPLSVSFVCSEFFGAGLPGAPGGGMAVWKVMKRGGNVALTYHAGGSTKQCGSGPAALAPDLVAWVADSAAPWDVIAIEGCGTFVRVTAPFASA